MTKYEACIVTAQTGCLLCKLDDFKEFADDIMSREIFTHEYGDKELWAELKKRTKADMLKIVENLE